MVLPSLFLSHGAPTMAIQSNDVTRAWERLANALPRPEAIVMVSAHWDTSTPLENARAVAASLRRATLVEVVGGNHGALYNLFERWPPMRNALGEFLRGREAGFPATVDDTAAIRFAPPR